MSYYESMQELIGNTPIVKLNHVGVPSDVNLFAKLELYNPSGSVKDRTGKYMIEDAEKKGLLKEGGTIIEGTAGNTGLGIAFAALKKGYRVIFVVPTKFSEEKQTLMRALGAEIINNGKIDYVVAGAGSGGTFSGVLKYLKERNKNIKGILADPVGSTMGGGEHADYNIEGIGNDFIADTMDMSLVDEVIKVNDDEAFFGSRELARKEGIIAGSSSGAAFAAAKKLIVSGIKGNIVIILPDRGDRYFSKKLFE